MCTNDSPLLIPSKVIRFYRRPPKNSAFAYSLCAINISKFNYFISFYKRMQDR